jgi:hypothetical protein
MPGFLALAPYLREYADVFRIAGPQPLIRPVLAVAARFGRSDLNALDSAA